MAETLKIIELDIDFNKLITSTATAKTKVSEYRNEMSKLKSEHKENTEEYIKLEVEMKKQQAVVNENTKLITNLSQVNEGQTVTLKDMKVALAVATAEFNNLTEEEIKNTEHGKAVAKQKTDLTVKLKELESATGDNRRNVGNYSDSLLEAGKKMGLYNGSIGGIITSLNDMRSGLIITKQALFDTQAGATGFAGAMKIIQIGIASTGIGFLIIALSALLVGLSKIDPVVDALEQVFAGLGAAFDSVTSIAIRFYEGITSLGDAFEKLGNILTNPMGQLNSLADEMKKAGYAAAELKKKQQDLGDEMQNQDVISAKNNQQIKEYIVQSKNRSLTEAQRLEFLKKATDLETEDFKNRSILAQRDLELTQEKIIQKARLTDAEIQKLKDGDLAYATSLLNRGLIGKKELDEFKRTQLAKIAILDETTQRQEKIQNQSDALAEKAQAAAEKKKQDAEKAQQEREAKMQKHNELVIATLQENLRLQELIAGKQKEILDDNTFNDAELRLANLYIEEKKLLEQKYLFEQAAAKGNKEELLLIDLKHKNDLLELNTKYDELTKANLKELSDYTISVYENEIENIKKSHEAKVLLQNEANERTTKQKEFDDERKAIDFANSQQLAQLQGASELETKVAQLEAQEAAELKAAEKSGANKNVIHQKYELAKLKISKEVQNQQLTLFANGLGTVAELLGKNTVAGKAAGIAQATINTYLGVSQVLAAPPSGPEPMNTIIKAVSIASTIATGIANVANIVKVPTKFESGGVVAGVTGGKRHSSGGTKYVGEDGHVVELEQGENWYVLNRNASNRINALSALNESYGGVSFRTPNSGGLYADGGLVSRDVQQIPDISGQIAKGVSDGIKSYQPVVAVQDIISGIDSRVSLVDGAQIG